MTARRVLPRMKTIVRYPYPMTAARRAPRGTVKDAIGIFARIDPVLYEALEEAVSERGITKRELIVAAIRTELAHPTVTADQEEVQEAFPIKNAS